MENICMQNFNNFRYEKITSWCAIIPSVYWKIIKFLILRCSYFECC